MRNTYSFFKDTSAKITTATISLGQNHLRSYRSQNPFTAFLQEAFSNASDKGTNFTNRVRQALQEFNFKLNNRRSKHVLKKSLRVILPLLFLVVLVLVIRIAIKSVSSSAQTPTVNSQLVLAKPTATENINKPFTFTLKDSNGKDAGSFTFIIKSAELDRQIIVQNKPLVAVAGREFLILNLKIVNKLDKGININTRDYIRLSSNNDTSDWLAPEIHNDPVGVQAISTTYTRVGFPIYTTDKHLLLQVGEINGKKQRIPLNIQ